jgi:hypothetical protein
MTPAASREHGVAHVVRGCEAGRACKCIALLRALSAAPACPVHAHSQELRGSSHATGERHSDAIRQFVSTSYVGQVAMGPGVRATTRNLGACREGVAQVARHQGGPLPAM